MDPFANGGILLDVRTPEETAQGAFAGAVLIPIDELPHRLAELERAAGGRDRPILVMCKLGRRAERATRMLRSAGFTRACNVGGIEVEPLRSMVKGFIRPGQRTHEQWARFGLRERERCYARWLASLRLGAPDYNALIGAYRHAYGAEVNYLDAGIVEGRDGWGSKRASEYRRAHARQLEQLLGMPCY